MKRITLSVALFFILSLAYHLMTQKDVEEVEGMGAKEEPIYAEVEDDYDAEIERALEDKILALAEALAPEETEGMPEGVIEDEVLLRFSSEEGLGAFLERAGLEGLEVISSDRRLKAARVRMSDEFDISRIGGLGGDDAELGFNYEVVVPDPPSAYVEGVGTAAFEQSALQWLGVPENNENWGDGVKVAILDSGIVEHDVLDGSDISYVDLAGGAGTNGHGTAVASIIGGSDGVGVAPGAELLSVRVLGADGKGDSFTLAQGIMQAVEGGADVISMSLGSFGYSSVLEDAVNYANERGVLMVASTGNDSQSEVTYPARFENVVGVAAVDANAQHSGFSNYGEGVDIAAPGVGVVAAWEDESWVSFSGTSASVPFVAGAVAGIMSEESISDPYKAYELLSEYTNDTGAAGRDDRTGAGVLNVGRVVDRNEVGLSDVAVADVFLDLDNASDGRIPVVFTVQNRGTSFVNAVELQYSLGGGLPQEVQMGALNRGEVASYSTYLWEGRFLDEEGVDFFARSSHGGGVDEDVLNDEREGRFQLVLPEGE